MQWGGLVLCCAQHIACLSSHDSPLLSSYQEQHERRRAWVMFFWGKTLPCCFFLAYIPRPPALQIFHSILYEMRLTWSCQMKKKLFYSSGERITTRLFSFKWCGGFPKHIPSPTSPPKCPVTSWLIRSPLNICLWMPAWLEVISDSALVFVLCTLFQGDT